MLVFEENCRSPIHTEKNGQYFIDTTGDHSSRFDMEEMPLVFEGKEQNSWEFKWNPKFFN